MIQIYDAEGIDILKGVVGKDHVHMHVEYRMDEDFAKDFFDGTKDFSEFTGSLYKYPFTSHTDLFSKTTCVQNLDEIVICDETIFDQGGIGNGGSPGVPFDPAVDPHAGETGAGPSGIVFGWLCDWRGSLHDRPSDCTGPAGGNGHWIYGAIPDPDPHTGKRSATAGRELTCCDDAYVEGTVGIDLTLEALSDIIDCMGMLRVDQFNDLKRWPRKTIGLKNFLMADQCGTEARAQGEKIIDALGNGSWVSWFPLVKYPTAKAAEYKNQYPKLTEFLKNELPNVQFNQKVIDAIYGLTEAPKEVITEALQWGKGPEIRIEQLGGTGDSEKLGSYRGHAIDELVNVLFLDVDLVNKLESSSNLEFSNAMTFLIAVTILHEYTHLGDTVFGDSFWGNEWVESGFKDENEAGILFEEEVFGERVDISSAGVVLRRTGGL